ncbi:hypothetical protein P168DRAFT_288730 [Aspergillus campestris IBT 28561]|uniref:Uncharacterized protein n=1 Tax=Aspergillus campestris (strain IBT 28561) TaxID=1392248 RepID=A0A2I1DAE0_ASPC2|nr:uncharacterized protein P168DRAFT_288730 [Aspergillus campestris IBT 28561]PKY06839.1 hypothetical protein P168DRAFT_288730 [Aspergillus campestris IBT 28561]
MNTNLFDNPRASMAVSTKPWEYLAIAHVESLSLLSVDEIYDKIDGLVRREEWSAAFLDMMALSR